MLDASGSYAGGFFHGENLRIANPKQCDELNEELHGLIALHNDSLDEHLSGINSTSVVPFFVQNVVAKYATNIDNVVRRLSKVDLLSC